MSPSTHGKGIKRTSLGTPTPRKHKKIIVLTPTPRKSKKILFSAGYDGKESNLPKKPEHAELLPNAAKVHVHTCIKL